MYKQQYLIKRKDFHKAGIPQGQRQKFDRQVLMLNRAFSLVKKNLSSFL